MFSLLAQNPAGQINMRDTRVEEVEQISSDSDSDENGMIVQQQQHQQHQQQQQPDSLGSASSSADAAAPPSSSSSVGGLSKQPTVGIFPNHVQQGPTYLIFPTQEEKERWLYHLTVVSGGNPKQGGTHFERLLQRLMEAGGDPAAPEWRSPAVLHSKEAITAPLTTFTCERAHAEAVKLFKVWGVGGGGEGRGRGIIKLTQPTATHSL